MPKSSAASTASGMLNDLKSRLGFARNDEVRDEGDFDEYDDFDEGFNERNDREFAGYGADYDENAPVGAYQPATTRSSRFSRMDVTPNLVSIDDVKARTAATPDLQRSSYSSTSASRSGRIIGGRNLIDERAPAESSPAYNASLKQRESEALARGEVSGAPYTPSGSSSRATAATAAGSRAAYAPAGASGTAYGVRNLTVVKPLTYADAERVARALKAGDMVVLVTRAVSDDLAKRLLDFSFGAASVLDATVDCPAERVFAIGRGAGLSDDEKRQLRSQGVL